MKATGGATAHALMTAHRKTKDNWVMDGILHASALEQMGPRSQSVSSTYEQVKFGKLSQLWKNLPPHSYTHTHTHTLWGLFSSGSLLIFCQLLSGPPVCLLLLLSLVSRVQLCATPWTAPNRLLHPWDSPGKNTRVGCHFLPQCMKVKSEK